MMNKLIISGYGKMGKEIEKLAQNYNFKIFGIIDNPNDWETKANLISQADVIIDFSTPEVVIDNIRNAFHFQKPIVVGTTGWHDRIIEIEELTSYSNGTLVYASNFSIGMNIFFEVNKFLASMMNNKKEFTVEMEEIHHIQKLDSPSGTAIALAEQLIEKLEPKQNWVNEPTKELGSIPIISKREASVPGTHIINYKSEIDEISISHKAKNRQGFAQGSMVAAQWIIGKKGFYNFSDILFNKD